ncbi:hypothetical protein CFP65_6398 [Kitasatospora sp. MMS16-BH015]|uniref:hypothetical protein n=1 Tax=Kitasatospora sp. MMS16-BH015 TaxID=2018025 RepID=UPI000CA334B5|nr:hypothetical protein [Kitasatospora sp. MMS16-BH015]AUG81054.1 hypothetical protein CFP65_6398 [Kitasatospora sp. MMS16-BH015]
MNAQSSAVAPAPLPERFPLPQRHRRVLACAAVAASIALGTLGVAATVETVGQATSAVAASR